MDVQAWAKLALLAVLVLSASLQGLAASGQFPHEHRKPGLTGIGGSVILFGSMALSIVAVLTGLYAARSVPWYALIIGAGAMLLLAPLALQPFSDRFVDGRGALLTFSAAAVACALILLTFAR